MTQNHQELHRHQSSTQQFLVSKTDTQNIQPIQRSSVALDELFKKIPGILSNQSFMDAVNPMMASLSEFSAMAIQIDALSNLKSDNSDAEYPTKLLTEMMRIMNSICKMSESAESLKKRGIWGILNQNLFVSFFPEKKGAYCLALADKIRQHVSERWNETLTIGIAWYPFFHFKKERIFENIRKALTHATFYGPGGTACFDAISLNISGDTLYQQGDIQGAMKEFRSGIQVDSSNANLFNSLGVCYGVLEEYEKALKSFQIVISLNPEEMMAIYNAGLIHMLMGNKNKARELFVRANKMSENIFEVAFQTGRVCFELGKFKEGKSFLKKAIRIRPDSGSAFRYLGECYLALKMENKAMCAYKKALKRNPYDAASLSAMGYLFDVLGENPEISVVFCQHSVALAPENGLFRYRLGRLYLKQNKTDDALNQFSEAVKYGHDDGLRFIKMIQEQNLKIG